MAKLIKLTGKKGTPDVAFHCPGCGCDHGVWTTQSNCNNAVWTFNGDMDRPTFSPSIKVNMGNGKLCHSFVKEGRIQYLTDCSHPLKGQTIELPDYV